MYICIIMDKLLLGLWSIELNICSGTCRLAYVWAYFHLHIFNKSVFHYHFINLSTDRLCLRNRLNEQISEKITMVILYGLVKCSLILHKVILRICKLKSLLILLAVTTSMGNRKTPGFLINPLDTINVNKGWRMKYLWGKLSQPPLKTSDVLLPWDKNNK